MVALGTWLYTKTFGKFVGEDVFGNRYYRSRKFSGFHVGRPNTERRWVQYNGLPEPSKVPPAWHGWLHHITDEPPTEEEERRKIHKWEREHSQNLTGTELAYRPPGHISQGGKRDKSTGDYIPWTPK